MDRVYWTRQQYKEERGTISLDIYEIRQMLTAGTSIYDLPLRVTYYARVSTDKDEQLHSLAAQVNYYNDFISKHKEWSLVPGYVDEGISGTSVKKRDNFLRMIEDAQAHQFDFILTKEISRFSRSTLDSIHYTQELLRCGVGVFFQSDNINTLLPDSELRLTIMSSVAQEEVRKTSERVRFGFKRAIEHGVVLGSNRIWGYRKEKGRLCVEEQEAVIVRTIFDLYANQQQGIRTIAAHLTEMGYLNSNGNPFSFSTIRGILSNPKYKGYYCGGKSTKVDYKLNTVKAFSPDQWVLYKDCERVPPIVSEELWEKANRLLDKRSNSQRTNDKRCYQNRYSYSGKIFCGIHHKPYYRGLYHCKSGDKEIWRCQEYIKNGKNSCNAPMLYTNEINSIIHEILNEIWGQQPKTAQDLLQIYMTSQNGEKMAKAMRDCRAGLEELMHRKDKLLDLNISGQITDEEFCTRNQRFNLQYREQEERLKQLEREQLKNDEQLSSPALQQAIAQELLFEDGFDIGVVDAMLDHIDVYVADSCAAEVEVFLKTGTEPMRFQITRSRGKPSVCSRQHI